MPAPVSPARPSPALILQGRISEVDAPRWLCKVRVDGRDDDVTATIPSVYSHPMNGEGIHFLPEVGAFCYVCFSSDKKTIPFLLSAGAATVPKDRSPSGGLPGSMDMFRPLLTAGDIALLTRDGNGLTLRRGGVTELKGTSLAKIVFNPTMNQVFTIAENYRVQTFGGSTEWKNLRREEDSNGQVKTRLSTTVKEYATSKGYSVRLQMGATEGDPVALQADDSAEVPDAVVEEPVVVTLSGTGEPYTVMVPKSVPLLDSTRVVDFRIYEDETVDETDLKESLTLGMDREGDVLLETEGAIKIDVPKKWVEIVVGGSTPFINTEAGGAQKVLVTTGAQGSTEPVTRGYSFLSDLAASLTEIKTALNGLGIPTVSTDALLANILTSVADGAPYLSTTLESE